MKMISFALLLCFVSSTFTAAPPVKQGRDRDHSHPPALKLIKSYPPLKSIIKTCGKKGCESVSLVTSVKKLLSITGDKWEYTYVFSNAGKRTCVVGSSVLDRAVGSDSKDVVHLYRLKPGKSVTITIIHEDPPVEYMGVLKRFNKEKHDESAKRYKERGVEVVCDQPTYRYQMSGAANGWLPKGLLPEKKK